MENNSTSSCSKDKADEVEVLLRAVQSMLISFISNSERNDSGEEHQAPLISSSTDVASLRNILTRVNIDLPDQGAGKIGLMNTIKHILDNSINTWSPGFMHKLYASTNAVGVVSELVLAVLNTASHVFEVSPALTVVEKVTSKALASLFGLDGPYAGGITCPGGSASNLTALVIARNTLFPETKQNGNVNIRFVMFTSEDGHYSHEKAAQICGIGSLNCWPVPVDAEGRMKAADLQRMIISARRQGLTPFYVNATAGTTVFGAYDPLVDIAKICKAEKLWLHVDASWGGAVVFSEKLKYKMQGSEFADSLTINPHKMMGVPLTCSFLLGADLRKFWKSNTLPAGYLFHNDTEDHVQDETSGQGLDKIAYEEVWDLADLTLQCGRRGDALKLALGWSYYGKQGYESQIEGAFEVALRLASLVRASPDLSFVGSFPPPCLQVCFYYTPGGILGSKEYNTLMTKEISGKLKSVGFMIDHAPGSSGSFFRVVINLYTKADTVERLVGAIQGFGNAVHESQSAKEQSM